MVVVAAWTWVHGSNEHERAGIRYGIFRARDIYDAILKRLPQDFEHGTLKFRQFIAKEHSIMGQTDLPWLRICTASDECHL
jgi:hypothetical protein